MLVTQVLNNKGRAVFTVSPEDTVSSAAALLYARKVGAFVVTKFAWAGGWHDL